MEQANDQQAGGVSAEQRAAMRERIRAAADRVEQCSESLRLAVRHRDELIVEAFEADTTTGHNRKHSERTLAAWARLSQSRIHGIIAAA